MTGSRRGYLAQEDFFLVGISFGELLVVVCVRSCSGGTVDLARGLLNFLLCWKISARTE